MNGFEKRRMQKKKAIIESAIDMFTKYGFKRVSISEIANKANVSQVTIYNLFESKQGLKEEVVKELFKRIFDLYDEILESDENFKEKIESMFSLKMGLLENQIMNIVDDLMDPNGSLAKIMEESYDYSISRFFDIIEKGKKEGAIRNDISNETIGIYFDMIKSYYYDPKKGHLLKDKKITEELYRVFWYGLMNHEYLENEK